MPPGISLKISSKFVAIFCILKTLLKEEEAFVKKLIEYSVADVVRAATSLTHSESISFIETASQLIAAIFRSGGKVLVAGNGGSLCDATHFAEELTGQFRLRRKALPAIALSDPGHLSCVANDMGFDAVFSRAVEALGRPGDLLIVLTTSGNSKNIVQAVSQAKKQGMKTIALLGKSGGAVKGLCDLEWIVEGFAFSDRVQEAHMAALHLIVEMVEHQLFYAESKVLCEC